MKLVPTTMNLVPINYAVRNGELPFTRGTIYRWHSAKRYPKLIVKIGGRLYFNMDEWDNMVQSTIDKQIEESKEKEEDNVWG